MTETTSPSPAESAATVPVPKLENDFYDWYARHAAKAQAVAAGPHDLVFIGDSITHLFEGDPALPGRGEKLWTAFYGARRPLNLGFGWDRTQNVLWRLDHGEFAGQTPRLVVLLIGTNNLTGSANAPTNSPIEILAGIRAVCQRLHATSPASRILVMGVFPRSTPEDPLRQRIRELNALLRAETTTWPRVLFADIGERFLSADGTIPTALMNDRVHPTEAGYRIWADAIEPIVAGALGPRRT